MKQISDNSYPWKQVLIVVGLFCGCYYFGGWAGRGVALIGLSMYQLTLWFSSGNVRVEAFDAGDAVVLKEGTDTYVIPLSAIVRVSYVRRIGRQMVVLLLAQSSSPAPEARFVVSQDLWQKRYNAIADNLHARSGCCHPEPSGGQGLVPAATLV